MPAFAHGFWGSKLRPSCQYSRHLTNWAVSPVTDACVLSSMHLHWLWLPGKLPPPNLPGDYTSLSRYELGFPLSRDPLAPLLVPHNPIRTRTGSLGRSNPTGPSVHLLWTQGHVSSYASDHLPMKFSAGRAHPQGTGRNGFDLSWTPFPSTMFGTQKLLSIVDQWINRGLVQSDQCRTFHKCRMGT